MVSAALTLSFLVGLALLSYGAWLAWQPAGFIAAGGFLVLIPILWTRGQWASSTR